MTAKTTGRALAAALLLLSLAATVLADELKLKDGRKYDGKVVGETDTEVKFKTQQGTLTFKKEDVAEIVAKKSYMEEVDERLGKLDPNDASKYVEAAKWVMETGGPSMEGVAVRLANLAMALDPRYFADAQLLLGDYYLEKKKDRKKAAVAYQKALQADPTNPACKDKYSQVKDAMEQTGSTSDQKLLDGLALMIAGNYDAAQGALDSGRGSAMRQRVEDIVGMPIDQMIDFCVSRTGCKVCLGKRVISCHACKGKMESPCDRCNGKGYTVVQSIRKNTYKTCSDCQGWGRILCLSCKAKRNITAAWYQNRNWDTPGVPDSSKEYIVRPSYTLVGGTEPCRVCKGKDPRQVNPPDNWKLSQAQQMVDRQMKGTLSLWEMSLTRMPRVGGPGRVDDADKLLGKPVWWSGDFVSIVDRKAKDPNFRKGSPDATGGSGEPKGPNVSDAPKVRQGAVALDQGNQAAPLFEAGLRKTLGLGSGGAKVASKQTFFTTFVPRGAGGNATAGVAGVEVTEGGKRLKPCLVEIAEEFSARRIELDAGDGAGLKLEGALDSAFLSAAGSKVRIYYAVADSKDLVTPGADRDTVVTRLVVKVALVDVIDAGGNVVATTK